MIDFVCTDFFVCSLLIFVFFCMYYICSFISTSTTYLYDCCSLLTLQLLVSVSIQNRIYSILSSVLRHFLKIRDRLVGLSKNQVLKCTQSNIEKSGRAEAIFVVGQTIIENKFKESEMYSIKY